MQEEKEMLEYKVIKEWTTKAGLKASCVINQRGVINGYVAVDKHSEYYKLNYNVYSVGFEDLHLWLDPYKRAAQGKLNNIDVHYGLTYSREGSKYTNLDGWVFGFDTAHSGDAFNLYEAFKHLSEDGDNFEEFYERNNYMSQYPGDTYKDLDFVINECEKLAKQLRSTR